MAFNFPDAPTIGEIANGYNWDGEKWNVGTSFDGLAMDFPDAPTIGEIAYDYTWDGEKWTTDDFYTPDVETESGPIGLLFLMMGLRGVVTPPPGDGAGPIGLLFLTMGVR